MKGRQTSLFKITAWLVLFVTIVALFPMARTPEPASAKVTDYNIVNVAAVRDDYDIGFNQNGDLVIIGYYYKNSTATVSYRTTYLYFHTEHTGGNPTSDVNENRYFQVGVAQHDSRDSVTRPGYVEDIYCVDHVTLRRMAETLYSIDELSTQKTVYMSEGFNLKKRKDASIPWNNSHIVPGKPYNTLEGIRNAGQGKWEWSDTTYRNFELYFDFELKIDFDDLFGGEKYKLEVEEEGNGLVSGSMGEFFAGESVYEIASPDNGYYFKEWKGNKIGIEGVDWDSGTIRFNMPARDVKLTAVFAKIEDGVTPVPTNAPITVTPIPTPKVTPTPPVITEAPETTPTPTPIPANKIDYEENYRYYTTDKGYTIGLFANTPRLPLVTQNGVSTAAKSNLLVKNNTYSVGKDSAGNEWYFAPSGSSATYVHPKTYKGYSVDGGGIQYIQELTFPSKITCNGTTYTVTTIGGACDFYSSGSGDDRNDKGNGTYYSRDKITGSYSYIQESTTSNSGGGFYQRIGYDLSYIFGVIGNGEIISNGQKLNQWGYRDGTTVERSSSYASTYEVYNTTLAEITIPNTVTKIEPYAFANCVALTKINGGDKLQVISANSFMVNTAEVKLSVNAGANNFRNYLYNESQAFTGPWTPIMYEYDDTRQLSEHLALAAFPALKTIGVSAFSGRSNLHDVSLPEGLTTIAENAFYNCRLNTILIPGKNTVINGDRETLGTKGYLPTGKTEIHSVPDSKAMLYGLDYNFYYSLKCGYEVEYVNNFEPEETYLSRAELREELVEAIETYAPTSARTEESSFLVSLSAKGDLYFRTNSNIVPQKLDFGSKVVDIERIDGKQFRGDAGNVYAYTEDGRVFGYSKYNKVNDEKTPYVSEWIDIGVPEGASSYQWVTAFTTYSTYSTSDYGYSRSSTDKGTIYLYYVTKEGNIEYTKQGSVSRSLGAGGSNSAGGWENPESTTFTGSTTVQNSTKYTVPNPAGVTFKSVSIASWQGGGIDAQKEQDSSSKNVQTYNSTQILPTIFATDTNGGLWVATASLTYNQSYEQKYNSSKGKWEAVSGAPIVEDIEKIAPEHYVWEKTNIRQVWSKQSAFGNHEEIGLTNYSFYAIREDGAFCHYANPNVLNSVYLEDTKFYCRKVYDDYSFLVDEEGYLWFCPDNTSVAPIKLFNDAEVTDLTKSVTSTSASWQGGGYSRIYTHFSLFDSNYRLWRFTWETYYTTSQSVGGSYKQSTTYSFTETPFVAQTFPARVKKIETKMLTGSDSDGAKNKTLYGPKQESTLYLLENGEIWAYGCNANSEDMWYTSQSIGYHGYYCMIGSGSFKTPTKISGDIYFEDVVHKTNYSLAIDKNGTVYRTGHYMEDKGDLVSENTYNPAEYRGFTPVTTQYEYSDGNIFLAGYHFVETLYDNMFTRDGYTFLNWNEEPDNSGTPLYPNEDLEVEAPVTLYAQWEKTVNKVRYHGNGGSGVMADSVCDPLVTKKVTLSECLYTKEGHGFIGWNTKKDGTGTMYQPGTTFTTTQQTTYVYAQWEPLDYTLHVAEEEVRIRPVISESHELSYNEEFTVPNAMADRTYSVDYNLNKKSSMSTTPKWKTPTPLASNYTTAKLSFVGWELWEEIVKNTEYTYLNRIYLPGQTDKNFARHREYAPILFPYWGGMASYIDLPVAQCDGYWFIGWADTPNETDEEKILHAEDGSGAMYQPKGNETLYGFYRPKEYEIGLIADVEDADPGDITVTQTEVLMTFDETIPSVAVPESDCYIFMGYFDKLDADGAPTTDAVQYYDENGNACISPTTGKTMTWTIFDESVTALYAYFISEIQVTLDGRGATKQEQTTVTMTYEKVGPNVIPPEKTGYTFQGYYTGTRGTGKQYFDANGKGSAVWLEKKTDILYACWVQNPVELPEQDPTENPDVLPEERVVIEASLDSSRVHIYADDNDPTTGALTDVQPYLVSDVVIDGKLEAAGAIPSTENVAIRAKMGAWMLSSVLERRTGVDYVRVYVTVPYRTQYEDAETEELIISDIQYATYDFMVPKAWSYWVVADGGIYFPEKVVVENEALGDGVVEIPVVWNSEDAEVKPSYRLSSYGDKEHHVSWNANGKENAGFDEDGVARVSFSLSDVEYIVSKKPGVIPNITEHLYAVCYNAAWRDETQFTVKSDHMEVAGVTLLSDVLRDTGDGAEPNLFEIGRIAQKIEETGYGQAYKSEISLATMAENNRYETEAEVIYQADESNVGNGREKRIFVTDVNEINIHTPVVCIPEIYAEHEEMYQCKTVPENHTVLVLCEKGIHSDFVLEVRNTGYHSDKKGYGERSYAEYLAVKDGKKQNEVSFPFPVWLDEGNDKDNENDVCIDAGEWYALGCETQRFYLPVDTKEGSYEIRFRSVAINGVGQEEKIEDRSNTQPAHYVAIGTAPVYITGRLYDFTVYEVGGTSAWKEAEVSYYTVGPQAEDSDLRQTLPLRIGVHPNYQNMGGLPMGGYIKFCLKSVGSSFGEDAVLTVTPHLFSVAEGAYEAMDVYYEEETEQGVFLRKWDAEEQSFLIEKFREMNPAVFEWDASFSLPERLYVADSGMDVQNYQAKFGLTFSEDFWKKDAMLVLRFACSITNSQGETLYYGMLPANIANNIWQKEATGSYREDKKGNRFEILGGEVAVIYPGDYADGAYTTDGIY